MIPARSSETSGRADGWVLLAVVAISLILLTGAGIALMDAAEWLHLSRTISPLGVLPLALGAAVLERRGPRTRKAPRPAPAEASARFSIQLIGDDGAPQDLIAAPGDVERAPPERAAAEKSGGILRGPLSAAARDAMLAGVEGLGGRERAA
jgi:hypothetical protein